MFKISLTTADSFTQVSVWRVWRSQLEVLDTGRVVSSVAADFWASRPVGKFWVSVGLSRAWLHQHHWLHVEGLSWTSQRLGVIQESSVYLAWEQKQYIRVNIFFSFLMAFLKSVSGKVVKCLPLNGMPGPGSGRKRTCLVAKMKANEARMIPSRQPMTAKTRAQRTEQSPTM